MFDSKMISLIGTGLTESLYMTFFATLFAYVIGLPVGLILAISSPEGIRPNRGLNTVLGGIVNFLRSVPFIILATAYGLKMLERHRPKMAKALIALLCVIALVLFIAFYPLASGIEVPRAWCDAMAWFDGWMWY